MENQPSSLRVIARGSASKRSTRFATGAHSRNCVPSPVSLGPNCRAFMQHPQRQAPSVAAPWSRRLPRNRRLPGRLRWCSAAAASPCSRRQPQHAVGAVRAPAVEPALAADLAEPSAQLGQMADEAGEVFALLAKIFPADPAGLVVLAIGIVVAVLRIADLVA